jgi:hypothetical protein
VIIALRQLIVKILQMDKIYFANPINYIFVVATFAYLGASMFYSYSYRDFSSMKSIYIFPGLIAFIKMFTDGYNLLAQGRSSVFINGVLILIIWLSAIDIGFLICQLY